MQHFRTVDAYKSEKACAVTLGKFDGFHRGHQKLLKEIQKIAMAEGLDSVVVSISKPLDNVILTREEKVDFLEERGISSFVECPFTPEFLHLEPEEFVKKVIVEILHAKWIVVGMDFRFGYQRKGNVTLLRELGRKYGFELIVEQKQTYLGDPISSTRIRKALSTGNMEDAKEMLGYDYGYRGKVLHGNAVGRKIGMPTVNVEPAEKKIVPPFGVYESRVCVGTQEFCGITNVGVKPTVGGTKIGVETFLYEFEGDLYEQELKVMLLHYERPEQKFPSVEALKEQLDIDWKTGKAYFGI